MEIAYILSALFIGIMIGLMIGSAVFVTIAHRIEKSDAKEKRMRHHFFKGA